MAKVGSTAATAKTERKGRRGKCEDDNGRHRFQSPFGSSFIKAPKQTNYVLPHLFWSSASCASSVICFSIIFHGVTSIHFCHIQPSGIISAAVVTTLVKLIKLLIYLKITQSSVGWSGEPFLLF